MQALRALFLQRAPRRQTAVCILSAAQFAAPTMATKVPQGDAFGTTAGAASIKPDSDQEKFAVREVRR
jgi:hypothetical protein